MRGIRGICVEARISIDHKKKEKAEKMFSVHNGYDETSSRFAHVFGKRF